MISHDRSRLPLDKPRKLTERSPLAAGQLDLELNEPVRGAASVIVESGVPAVAILPARVIQKTLAIR